MESQEVLNTQGVSNNSSISCGDGLERLGSGVKGSDNLGVELVEDFDSYCEDINDRLTVSRMVNDVFIRGIVRAVEQEAAENVEAKELEVACLKRSLHLDVGEKKFESYEREIISYRQRLDLSNIYVEHDKMRESLGSLRYAVTEQFDKLKKETCGIRGCNSIRRINSGSELVGLGGILDEKETERCAGVDRTVDNLKMTEDTIITLVDDTLRLSKISLCEWQQEQEFQREVEAMVMQSSIRSLQEEFEQKLWDQNATFQSVNWFEKFDEISNLRKELDVILKLLPNHENGQLDSNGWGDVDHSHLKDLNLSVGVEVTEDFDADKFKHMSKVDMAKHFNSIIRDIKRDYESNVQRLTEEFISWKGKFLNKMRPSLLNRKDKEFDLLKKKIPEVILKLDDIIVDNEKLPVFPENDVSGLNDRIDSLLLENRQLRDLLTDKKNEVKCLSSQVSDATEKTLQYSSAVEDVRVEVSILEEVYKCVIEGLSGHIKSNSEESEMKSSMIQEIHGIIFGEATLSKMIGSCEIEDSDMESLVMLEMCGFLFRESIKDATGQLKELHQEYLTEKESRVSLEMKVVEKEEKVALLRTLVEEKEKLAVQQSETLMKKSQQFDLAYKELNELRDQTKSQQQLISETCKDLDLVKGELKEALQQIEVHKMEINSLNKHLELQIHKLEKANKQKKMLVAIRQTQNNHLSGLEAQEKELRKQMEAVIGFGHALSEQFTLLECKVSENIKSNNLRLIDSKSQLSSLTEKAHMLTKAGLQYKQRLERRCSDLKMAEAEVDLLGDEVEVLLSLLEKIYIALDHYSPILQHYPGVIEILKLVKRELSGEPSKSV